MRLVAYSEALEDSWDDFVETSWNGTLLHTRRFISYDGDKFKDHSVVILDEKDRVAGVFPAAPSLADKDTIISHPGLTYGGLVQGGALQGEALIDVFRQLCSYYAGLGFRQLQYKAVPTIYHRVPAQDDLYSLFRVGAVRSRCDLSSTIDLDNRATISNRRVRGARKAKKQGIVIKESNDRLRDFFGILTTNLGSRYNVRPTHTVEDLNLLQSRFPEAIQLVVACRGPEVVAGTVLFVSPKVVHAQYLASSDIGREISAMDAVVEFCIEKARSLNKRYFSLGISNEEEGKVLNKGLHTFKSGFGAGGVVHEVYAIDLSEQARLNE